MEAGKADGLPKLLTSPEQRKLVFLLPTHATPGARGKAAL